MSLIQDALKRKSGEPPDDDKVVTPAKPPQTDEVKPGHSATRAKIDVAVKKEEAVLAKPRRPSVLTVLLFALIPILVIAVLGFMAYYIYNEAYVQDQTVTSGNAGAAAAVPDEGPADFEVVPDDREPAKSVKKREKAAAAEQRIPWPSLKVGGVFPAPDEAQASAIINDNFVPAGSTVSGAKLKSVTADGVILEFQDEESFIGMGRTTADRQPVEQGSGK